MQLPRLITRRHLLRMIENAYQRGREDGANLVLDAFEKDMTHSQRRPAPTDAKRRTNGG